MLNALAGGDVMEIIVAAKDLTAAGFRSVERNVAKMEATANGTNLGGFSKATKNAEADAAKLAGKEAKGGGGLGGLLYGLTGLPAPLLAVSAAVGGLSLAGIKLTDTFNSVQQSEALLKAAGDAHGISVDQLNNHIDANRQKLEDAGFTLADYRDATVKLTDAGNGLAEQQAALDPIMALAKAHNLTLAEASRQYELALMGNQRALKDLGIAMPKVTNAQAEQAKATAQVTKDGLALSKAHDHLAIVEATLAGKHKITAADALKLELAHKAVSAASKKLHIDQGKLADVTKHAGDMTGRQTLLNGLLKTALGDTGNATTPLNIAQAKLSDMWEKLATTIGPGLEDLFTRLITGISVLLGWFADFITSVGPGVSAVFGHIGDAIKAILGPISQVAGFLGNVAGTVGNLTQSVSNGFNLGGLIPHFAGGGVVDRPTLLVAGEGGEREYIVPQSKLGAFGAGRSIHVVHVHMDATELAYALEKPLAKLLNLQSTSVGMGSI